MRPALIAVVLLVAAAALLAFTLLREGGALDDGVVVIGTHAGPRELDVEVASTPEERRRGLSGRDSLRDGTGMAFVHDRDTERGLWMKGTSIPLSAAFATSDGTIVGLVDMNPCEVDPCPVYRPPVPYRTALEVAQGELRRLGVQVGDTLIVRRD